MGNLRFGTLIANEKAFKLRYDVLRVKRGAAHLRQIQESNAVTIANPFRPVTPPQVIEGAYSDDWHLRMFKVVRENGPWPLILAQHFKSPEEVIATTSGTMPEGFERSWDMFFPLFLAAISLKAIRLCIRTGRVGMALIVCRLS